MLDEHNLEFTYREYTKDPLTVEELRDVLGKLGVGPRDVLRKRDASKNGLTGSETDDQLLALMAEIPRLLQRPIGVLGDKAEIGRPVENLLRLTE
ncbi:MAG: arsenate reductase [Kiritimatiellia bacterium]